MALINIAFDIDGCCIDLYGQVQQILYKDFNRPIRKWTKYDICKACNIPPKMFWKAVKKAYFNWMDVRVYSGVFEVLEKLHLQTGDYIQFITARDILFASETHLAVKSFIRDIPYQIAFVNGIDNPKLSFLKRYDYFVEDRRKTAKEIAAIGKTVLVPKRDYNKMELPEDSNIIFIKEINTLWPFLSSKVFIKEDKYD